MVDTPNPGPGLTAAISELVQQTKDQTSALKKIKEQNKESKEHLKSLADLAAPVKLLGTLFSKLIEATIGNALLFDKMVVSNSDINMKLKGMFRSLDTGNIKVGKVADHMETTIRLHRIGYKTIDADLRESLVLMDKQGGQGQELIAFMGELLQSGASQKTQVEIAKEIAKVSQNTTTTARASMAALEQAGDLVPIFKALGIEGEMLSNLVRSTADMPKDAAIMLGKHFKELISPSDIKKSMLMGGVEFGNALLRSKNWREFDKVLKTSAPAMSDAISRLVQGGGDNVIALKKVSELMFGDAAKAAIAATEAGNIQKAAAQHQEDNVDQYQNSMKTYAESLQNISDTVSRFFEGGTIEALEGLRQPFREFGTWVQEMFVKWDIFGEDGVFASFGDWMEKTYAVWSVKISNAVQDLYLFILKLGETRFAKYVMGDIGFTSLVLGDNLQGLNVMGTDPSWRYSSSPTSAAAAEEDRQRRQKQGFGKSDADIASDKFLVDERAKKDKVGQPINPWLSHWLDADQVVFTPEMLEALEKNTDAVNNNSDELSTSKPAPAPRLVPPVGR